MILGLVQHRRAAAAAAAMCPDQRPKEVCHTAMREQCRRAAAAVQFLRGSAADVTKEVCHAAVGMLRASFFAREKAQDKLTRKQFLHLLRKECCAGEHLLEQAELLLDRVEQQFGRDCMHQMDALEHQFPGRCFNSAMDGLLLEMGMQEDREIFAGIS